MSELAFASATALAAKIQNKDISAVELLNFYLARTDSYNGELNAIVVDTREQALADAEQADADLAKGKVHGPLHGVPMTVKESFHLAGTASTWGNPALKDNVFLKTPRPSKDSKRPVPMSLVKPTSRYRWQTFRATTMYMGPLIIPSITQRVQADLLVVPPPP